MFNLIGHADTLIQLHPSFTSECVKTLSRSQGVHKIFLHVPVLGVRLYMYIYCHFCVGLHHLFRKMKVWSRYVRVFNFLSFYFPPPLTFFPNLVHVLCHVCNFSSIYEYSMLHLHWKKKKAGVNVTRSHPLYRICYVNIMLCQSPWSDWGMGTTASYRNLTRERDSQVTWPCLYSCILKVTSAGDLTSSV